MTSNQTKVLMEKFKTNSCLKKEERHQLARALNLSTERIAEWYRHRRFIQRQKELWVKGEYS